jgi:FkbM family methyltransferase
MKKLHQISFLRRLILPTFQRINLKDITIRHHWTDDKFTLHPFKHKGYWYHGKKRENETMLLFTNIVRKGGGVIEIGGHIGYISLYFAHLVGHEGQVTVFEPGPNNIPYIRKNTKANTCISVIEKAVTDYTGTAKFYIENLSGQNNSLLGDYDELNMNKEAAGIDSMEKTVVEVPCTTLDDFLLQARVPPPSFIKIDVEGAEVNVLNGMKDTLKNNDIVLMVEVTEKAREVFSLLIGADFQIFSPNKNPVDASRDVKGNVFCVKGNDDRIRIFSS